MSAVRLCPPLRRHSTTAGARPQEPRQRAVSNENLPSAVVSPGLIPAPFCTAVQQLRRALDVAGSSHAHHAGVFALRLQGEEVIESRDAIRAAQRHSQASRPRSGARLHRDIRTLPARCAGFRSVRATGGPAGAWWRRPGASACPGSEEWDGESQWKQRSSPCARPRSLCLLPFAPRDGRRGGGTLESNFRPYPAQ